MPFMIAISLIPLPPAEAGRKVGSVAVEVRMPVSNSLALMFAGRFADVIVAALNNWA